MPKLTIWNVVKNASVVPSTPGANRVIPKIGSAFTAAGQAGLGLTFGVTAIALFGSSKIVGLVDPLDLTSRFLEHSADQLGAIAHMIGDKASIEKFNQFVWGENPTQW